MSIILFGRRTKPKPLWVQWEKAALAVCRAKNAPYWYVPDTVLGQELAGQEFASWSLTGIGASHSFTNGVLAITRGTSTTYDSQPIQTVVGRSYQLSVNVVAFDTRAVVRVGTSAGGTQNADVTYTSAGQKTVVFTATAAVTYLSLYAPVTTASYSGWSVREVISSSAFTDLTGTVPAYLGVGTGLVMDRQYGSQNLGPDVVTYGDFADPSKWNVAGTWSVSGGKATATAAAVGDVIGRAASNLVTQNKYYAVTYTITGYTGGSVAVKLGNAIGVVRSANGTYTEFLTAGSTGLVEFSCRSAGTSLSVSNFTAKEVLGYNVYQTTAANRPTLTRVPRKLGQNLVTNGTFDSDSGWNKGTGWSIAGGQAATDGSQTGGTNLTQAIAALDPQKYYQVRFTQSAAAVAAYFGTLGKLISNASSAGTVSVVVSPDAAGSLYFRAGAGVAVSVDNVEVREVLEWTPALQFNDSSQTLITVPPAITTQASFVWAGTISDLSAVRALFAFGAGGFWVYVDTAGRVIATRQGEGASVMTGAVVKANTPIVISVRIHAGGITVIRINGVQAAASTNIVGASTGSTIYLNSYSGNSFFCPGTMVDSMVSNTLLTDAEFQKIERHACFLNGVTFAGEGIPTGYVAAGYVAAGYYAP